MKKILLTILAFTMMVSASTVFAQETSAIATKATIGGPVRAVMSTQGKIEEVRDGFVRVSGEGIYNQIVLHVQKDTQVVTAQDGTPVLLKDLKQGDAITAYYGPALTRSLPPQGSAIALVVGTPEKGSAGMYMKVANLEENKDGSIRVLCTNGDRLVTIRPETFAEISEIREGSELIVWYDIMTMSMPGQANAKQVVLLPVKLDIRVNTIAGVIVTNKQELNLSQYDVIKTEKDTVMLPLRVIAESLGYNIVWHGESNTIDLEKGGKTTTLTIGSTDYSNANTKIQLKSAPEIVNDTTLVPVEFFTDVLKLQVEVSNKEGFAL